MFKLYGKTPYLFKSIIGEITTKKLPFYNRYNKILITDEIDMSCLGYLAILTHSSVEKKMLLPIALGEIKQSELSQLKDEDIVSLSDNGEILQLWEKGSTQNALFLTEMCNCHCLMCPQPPQKHNPALIKAVYEILDLLKNKKVEHFCITGGEPTLFKKDFLKILKRINTEHPNALTDILTNGKTFADENYVKEIYNIARANNRFCISFHADIPQLHNEIVGKEGSFAETEKGIYHLAKYHLPIEIRFVISKLNYTRLKNFAEYLYRYFPFVSHIAFMSMETHGLASQNSETVYIDPRDYKNELREAVLYLSKRGLPVSIYNTPLCLCHEDIRPFARQSISSWKNDFIDVCMNCDEKENCCGVFTTSSIVSKSITPFSIYNKPINS